MLGDLGHLSIIIAFVTITMSGYAYYACQVTGKPSWHKIARSTFYVHLISVASAIACLFLIIYTHRYEYHYAWKHSSNSLPLHYIISCFWEGQEGSFLIWILWNALIGMLLIRTSKSWETSVMSVFTLIQIFLTAMIMGSYFFHWKIGSSPFILLRDAVSWEIFDIDRSFIPTDGNGLNPLLQNIWMVIHPPIIFLGFAISGVPFAYAIAAMWTGKLDKLVSKCSPWVLASIGLLGLGIIMGAYWAYETLNFGGYWNWDPVENAILIPWLIFLGAAHGMVLYRRQQKGLTLTVMLIISGFLLVVYSTFLTRSGILGNASVHSFTDLGLSGQLLLFLLFFIGMSIYVLIKNRSQLKESDKNTSVLSLDFWIFLGICVLGLSAFQILLPTSFPVLNVILHNIGIDKNFAAPADQVGFYSKFQLWFATAFCLLAGMGQLFYWRKITSRNLLENELLIPTTFSLALTSIIILFGKITDVSYMCLIGSASLLIAISGALLFRIIANQSRTSTGGLLAHLGMALMLIGVVFSAGQKKVLSKNLSINAPETSLPAHTVQENLLLSRNIPKENQGFAITYDRALIEETTTGTLVDRDETLATQQTTLRQTKSPLFLDGKKVASGAFIEVNPENTYYQLSFKNEDGKTFKIKPRMQNNPTMGYIASPDIQHFFAKDIYTHITNFPDPEKVKWNEPVTQTIKLGEYAEVHGLTLQLTNMGINNQPVGIPVREGDIALEAKVAISDQSGTYTARPVYHISKDRSVRIFPDEIPALGTKVMISGINPDNGEINLSVTTSQRDWITIKCIEMPLIGLVWLGAIILLGGVGVSTWYRIAEARALKEKRVELPKTVTRIPVMRVIWNQRSTAKT